MTPMEKLTDNVTKILQLDGTDIYDELLSLHIPSSISKLNLSGIPWEQISLDVEDPMFYQYSTCIAWLCMQLIDSEVNAQLIENQYVGISNQLRMYYISEGL